MVKIRTIRYDYVKLRSFSEDIMPNEQTQSPHLRSVDIISLLSPRLAWRLMRGMAKSVFDADFAGYPLAVCWFTNFSCNARCHFCCKAAEIRAGRNDFPPLGLDGAKRLLSILRNTINLLYLSGGEPTIHPHIMDILQESRRLNFHSVGISSNLIHLDQTPEILDYIDAIGVSLHAPDVQGHAEALNVPVLVAERVFKNLELLKPFAHSGRLKVLINCVIHTGNIHSVPEMIEFTRQQGFLLEVVPANEHGKVPAGLHGNPDYIALIDNLLTQRENGTAPHLAGSSDYFRYIRDFKPFRCFPYGVANIMPDGRLCTPCDVAGQYAVNVLDHENLKEAIKASLPFLGNYPCKTGGCYKAGIIERSRLFGLLCEGKTFVDD